MRHFLAKLSEIQIDLADAFAFILLAKTFLSEFRRGMAFATDNCTCVFLTVPP